jgi:5-methylcytosine-specific restriction protein A
VTIDLKASLPAALSGGDLRPRGRLAFEPRRAVESKPMYYTCVKCGKVSDLRYCPAHRGTTKTGRPSPRERGYGRAFERARAQLLASQPLCATGCGRIATVAHHDPPRRTLVAAGVNNPEDPCWLRGVCRPCHTHCTAGERQLTGYRGINPFGKAAVRPGAFAGRAKAKRSAIAQPQLGSVRW